MDMNRDVYSYLLNTCGREPRYWFGVAVAGLLCRFTRGMVAVPAEHAAYAKIVDRFYGRLVGKDVSFFREHPEQFTSGGNWPMNEL